MNPRNDVAAVIPCHNVAGYAQECIQSVLAQCTPFSEVILLDDGSTDDTYGTLRRYEGAPGVRVHHDPVNRGLGPARNLGVSLSTAEFVCFIDADDTVSPNLVAAFGSALDHEPALDMFCFSATNVRDGTGEEEPGFLHAAAFTGSGPDAFCHLIEQRTFSSCPVLYIFRRSLLDWPVAGFRRILHEDEELTPRLFLAARRVVVDPAVLYRRRLRAGSITAAPPSAASVLGCTVGLATLSRLYLRHIRNNGVRAALSRRIGYLAGVTVRRSARLALTFAGLSARRSSALR